MDFKKFTKRITNTYEIDKNTFMVEFEETFTNDMPYDKGDTEVVCVEYQRDENKWVLYKQYYDKNKDFIEHETDCFTPYDRAEYITMAQDEYKRVTGGAAWDKIVVDDDYEKYDAFVDSIKEYYAKGNDEVSAEVEDVCNKHFLDLLKELNIKFK